MGFGGGALIASPLSSTLLETYASNPVDAIVPSFLTLGAIYLISMMLGAFVLSLYIMVGVLVVGFVANLQVRPVDPRFHMEPEPEGEREEESAVSGSAAGSEGGTS
jgi:hypothetical protein